MNEIELKKVSEEADNMFAYFLNQIGVDGEWYSNLKKTPIIWGMPSFGAAGEYLLPNNPKIAILFRNNQLNEEIFKKSESDGLIIINKIFRNLNYPSRELFEALIHEKIHSNRLLLLHDAFRDTSQNELSYSNNNGVIEQNTNEYVDQYVDASQHIFKGSIDTSNKTIQTYTQKSSDEIEDAIIGDVEIQGQMLQQHAIDEALVELMAELSYKLYYNKLMGQEIDVWSAIEEIRDDEDDSYLMCDVSKHDDLKKNMRDMCDVVLRHHDFSLFYWMIDPITYSGGDLHYDFFGEYIKDDQGISDEEIHKKS